MHSRKKVPRDEDKEKERLKKATKFSAALNELLQKKSKGCKDRCLLKPISELLIVNPDFFTLWNYRREIFVAFKSEIDALLKNKPTNDDDDDVSTNEVVQSYDQLKEELHKLCSDELIFIENCIKVNFKSYGAWHHRYWLLTFMEKPNLDREFQLCDQLLQLDERNFHCWNFRRFVTKLAGVNPLEELKFSDTKIDENFSNFSSWHYRSSLLKELYRSGHNAESVMDMLEQDFERIQEAIFTDPTDQSVWFYLRWLISVSSNGLESLSSTKNKKSELIHINRLLLNPSDESDKYTLVIELSSSVRSLPSFELQLDCQPVELSKWICVNGSLWYTMAKWNPVITNTEEHTVQLVSPNNVSFVTSEPITWNLSKETSLIYCTDSARQSSAKLLNPEKYQSLRELLQLEPDNKWLNFTLAWLEFDDDVMNSAIDKLIQLDSLRANYYNDLRSKIVLRKQLSLRQNLNTSVHLDLSQLGLYSLRDTSQLLHLQYLNLSGNRLLKLGTAFAPLVLLRCLILDNNSIHVVDEKLTLPNLRILSLTNNRISKLTAVDTILSSNSSLCHLVLIGNPISNQKDKLTTLIQKSQTHYKTRVYCNQDSDETDIMMIISELFDSIRAKCACCGDVTN